MPAKISSDMPLPTPRSVICSPSHMMKTLPVVSVNMVISTKPTPGLLTKAVPPLIVWRSSVIAMPSDCTALSNKSEVAGPLGDLLAPQFAFLLQLGQRFVHHRHQLQNDGRGNVRHDAEREDRQPAQLAAAEQIDEAEEGAAVLVEELRQQIGVDTRRWDVSAEAVNRQQPKREQNALAQIGNAEYVG